MNEDKMRDFLGMANDMISDALESAERLIETIPEHERKQKMKGILENAKKAGASGDYQIMLSQIEQIKSTISSWH